MCSLAPIDQNKLVPSFEPSIGSSFSLVEGQGGCECLALAASHNKEIMQQNEKVFSEVPLELYKDYLKKRIRETSSNPVSTKELFEEIKAQGYRGMLRTVQTFASMMRTSKPPETSLQFHKEYIKKRIEEAAPESVSARQLFEEIKAKGYRGTLRTVQTFASMIRTHSPPEASLEFHKEYIKKRLTEAISDSVPTKELFQGIKAKGYRGTLSTVQTFVSMMRTSRSRASLAFHKEYIRKRIGEAVPTRKLFEEIKANGYAGAYSTLVTCVSIIQTKKHKAPEESFQFHKEYIRKRLETVGPEYLSARQLFGEITANGYAGAYNTVAAFVSTMRKKKNKAPEASLQFHKEYVKKRLEQAASESVSTKGLFEEIKAKGYQGTLSTVRTFASMIRTNRPPEASLQFHKEYIEKKLREAPSESTSTKQLFQEIKANGYAGAYNTVSAFVSTIRAIRSPKAPFRFHKGYIRKRLEKSGSESVSIKQLFQEIKANGYAGAYNTVSAFVSTIRTRRSPKASLKLQKDFPSKRLEGNE